MRSPTPGTAAVGTGKDTVVAPAGMASVAGRSTAGLVLARVAVRPPAGAGALSVSTPTVEMLPMTLEGVKVSPAGCTGADRQGRHLRDTGIKPPSG